MAEKTSPKPGTKKGKKTPKHGLEVIENLMELPPLPTYDDEMLQEILSGPVPTCENEYMQDPNKPLHTNFLVPNRGKKGSCPVFFGTLEEKQQAVDLLCNHIHQQTMQQWGTLSCYCGVVPHLKLSRTATNPNRLFVGCPKPREMKCRFFQWIDKPPLPKKTCNATALKKRFLEMAEETVAKHGKKEAGFTFMPDVYV